jgi:PAS domain-containing protein
VDDLYPGAPWVAEEHRAMDESLWKMPGSQSYEIKIAHAHRRFAQRHLPQGHVHRPERQGGRADGHHHRRHRRKKAKRRCARARSASARPSNCRFGIAHVDLNGRILRANRALCRILGYSADELAGNR